MSSMSLNGRLGGRSEEEAKAEPLNVSSAQAPSQVKTGSGISVVESCLSSTGLGETSNPSASLLFASSVKFFPSLSLFH